MILNQLTKQVIIFIAGFIAFWVIIGLISSPDYVGDIIDDMPKGIYEQISIELGEKDSSDFQIAKRYLDNKQYYDSLSIDWNDRFLPSS